MHGGKFIHIAAAFYAAPVHRAYQAFCRQIDDKLAAFFDQMVAVPFRPHTDGNHAGLGADGAAPANRDQVGRPSRAAAYQHRRFRVQKGGTFPYLTAHSVSPCFIITFL